MATNDPFDAATEAAITPRSYYGQIQIDAYFCVLVKGTGKLVYDPEQHQADQRRTAINISLLPLTEQNVSFELRRELIAESREWAGIILPSLKALGISNVRDANGKWAKMQQVPSGRKYRVASGDEKEATTFKFLALYPDEAACRAAYLADTKQDPEAVPSSKNSHSSKLAIARPFIAAFAKQNGFDLEKTRAACRAQKIITDAIDIESLEFAAIVAEALVGGK